MSAFKIQSLLLASSFMLVSCQADPADAQSRREIEEVVKNTPPLTRVSWKACGVEKILSMSRSVFNQCLEGSQLVWGSTAQYEIVKTRNFTTGIYLNIFVKSQGCLIMGEPNAEDFYLMKAYPVGLLKDEATLPNPTADVKIQQLSTQEKRQAIYNFVTKQPDPFFIGIPSRYDCQSKTNWQKN